MIYLLDYLANHREYIEEVAQLKFNHWLHTSPDRPYDIWLSEIEESAATDTVPLTLVTVIDSGDGKHDLAGFVTLINIDEREGIEKGLWMITLFVKEQYRHQGIGTHLIQRCFQECKQLDYTSLHLWTESKALTSYYAKQGWLLINADEDSGEDVMVYEVIDAS